MYKTNYPTYLVHFNKNHDPKNGQFAEGDGDGDGIANDHKNRLKNAYKKYVNWTEGAKKYNDKAKDIKSAPISAQGILATKILTDKNLTAGQKAMHVINSQLWIGNPVNVMVNNLRTVEAGYQYTMDAINATKRLSPIERN